MISRYTTVAVRHFFVFFFVLCAWRFLIEWYRFQHASAYCFFALFFTTALAVAGFNLFDQLRKAVPYGRMAAVLFILAFSFPWGEWFRLNVPSAREDWSLQLLKSFLFVYACIVILPFTQRLIRGAQHYADNIRSIAGSTQKIFLFAPALFFLLTTSIAMFHYHQTPMVEDSAAHLFQAKIFKEGKLYAPQPPVPDFFDYQSDYLAIHNGRWFSIYLPGFSALLALAMIFHAEWFLSPLLGGLTLAIWLKYIDRWYDQKLCLPFALLFLTSPFLLLMFGTIMVHSAELFFASATIYFCRACLERPRLAVLASVSFSLFGAIIVRGFSLLPFLTPCLIYTFITAIRNRKIRVSIALLIGATLGISSILFFQAKTTGNPFIPGYLVEVPDYNFGFGPTVFGHTHTPIRGLENISNYLLGLNKWLNGWLSGSLLFLMLFFVTESYVDIWDRLLFVGIIMLLSFYYLVVWQDLIFGPRYVFVTAPILLLLICRSVFPLKRLALGDSASALIFLFITTIILSVPVTLPQFLAEYTPARIFKQELAVHKNEKRVVFLEERWQHYINWNDPFLRQPVILCIQGKGENIPIFNWFQGYRPTYFRLQTKLQGVNMLSKYGFFETPPSNRNADLSLFHLALLLENGSNYLHKDAFDLSYETIFHDKDATSQIEKLLQEDNESSIEQPYKRNFKNAVVHAGITLLLPKEAFQKDNVNWDRYLDYDRFRSEFQTTETSILKSEEVGRGIREEWKRVATRIDKNSDGMFSDRELYRYLSEKILLLRKF